MAAYGLCATRINATHGFIAGGWGGGDYLSDAYLYDFDKKEWSELPKMTEERAGHACGLAENGVIVSGGFRWGTFLSSVEVLSLETVKWKAGPEMPLPIAGAASVQTDEDSFVLAGGATKREGEIISIGTIYQFDGRKNKWTERKETLKRARRAHAAAAMQKNVGLCTNVNS